MKKDKQIEKRTTSLIALNRSISELLHTDMRPYQRFNHTIRCTHCSSHSYVGLRDLLYLDSCLPSALSNIPNGQS
uniref:Ovule protein n=1 Tax=Caenorhabditis tropicalis TaxID=1561998 RepID=A0A1I7V3Y9_9PELO